MGIHHILTKMLSRRIMKEFNKQMTDKDRIEYVDKTINQLVDDFMT